MQDLLNEEEFIQSKPYNPWKRFMVFYGIAVLQTIVNFLIYHFNFYSKPLILFSFLITAVMPYIMIFEKRKTFHLPKKTILTAIIILMFVYSISHILGELIISNDLFPFFFYFIIMPITTLGIGIIYGLISFFVIWLIIKRKKALKATIQ